jgi:membrane associated rhomboid family serine protease
MWLLEVVDAYFLGQALNSLGIWPRRIDGLWGIILMPLLHGGMGHLAANTLPFLILGGLVFWRSGSDFLIVSLVTVLLSGLALWLFGASRAVYIGASGLIFGYFGFLVFRGYFERSPQSLLVALLVVVFYGGLLFGLVPQRNGISWEAHLFGFLSGALCARLLAATPISSSPPLVVVTIDDDD